MAESTWSYLQNPFDNVTKNSHKTMYLMATDHFDKLAARSSNATIAELYNFGKPYFDAFITQYRKNRSDNATYQMYTSLFENLMSDLSSTLIRKWDIQIQVVFDLTSSNYLALMPDGRKPYQSGAYDLRINAVKSLADQLALFPAFAALETEVNDFHRQILDARSRQQGVENTDQDNSTEVENTRLALAKAMHSIFGGLIHLFYTDLSKVETFYELKYLRRTPGSNSDDAPAASEEVTVLKGASATALATKITVGSTIRVTNIGAAVLTVFAAADGNASVPSNGGYSVAAEQSVTFQAVAGDSLILLMNDIDPYDGKALVELL